MSRGSAFAYVLRRSLGETTHGEFIESVYAEASQDLRLNERKVLHKQGMNVWHMALDAAEERFLLVGTGMASMHIYDMSALDALAPGASASDVAPIVSVRPLRGKLSAPQSQDRPGHTSGLTSVAWYPVDNGMFVSASLDTTVKVWDANELEVATAFCLGDPVHIAAFSPMASGSTSHLLAVGTDRPEVRLCDIGIGAASHRLVGHRASIRSLAWSNTNEFQLASGATDGSVRVWDIRRSGATACLFCLNHDGPADVPGRETSKAAKKRKIGHDPHVAASFSSALAHAKEVQSIAYTPDGRYLVTSGADRAMRLWNAASGAHMFHHYTGIKCAGARHVTVAMAQEGRAESTMLYHPVGSRGTIASYLLHDAEAVEPRTTYMGHYSRVTTCLYRATSRELVSGGEDGMIAMWSPGERSFFPPQASDTADNEQDDASGVPNEDAWSDEDDGPGDRFVPPILQRDGR
ncbi:DNA excision repair ERCC-8-like protein [Achlya hypogyna]|uniref:DNA excision repair ERCC-8-like protein n=1 Tax=Achlya hypogyna TaxID=1202772 RepID=A0A1V9Z9R4_ACHHY|nr:DNA excision repair ERCC-8-like protein [Achlya hypogyna]